MNEQDCQRNIRLMFVYTFLINCIVILPVLIPYYRDVIGLSFRDFLLIESIFSATVVVFDVPTGWLADTWGRRYCLIGSAFLAFAGFFGLFWATNIWQAIACEILLGIHVALSSGANSALLYDTLLSRNRESEYKKIEGKRISFQFYGACFASILGGYLYAIDAHLPLSVELFFVAGAVLMTWFLVEPERHKARTDKHPLTDIRETMVYALHGHREVAGLIVVMLLLFSTTKICLWAIQQYMAEMKIPESFNGWVFAGVMLVAAISARLGHRIFPACKGKTALQILLAAMIIFLLVAGMKNTYLGLFLISLEGFFFAYGMPRAQEVINRLVDSGRRATILSTASLATSLMFIPTSQLFGYVTDSWGIGNGLLVHAAILAILGSGAAYYSHRRSHQERLTATGA